MSLIADLIACSDAIENGVTLVDMEQAGEPVIHANQRFYELTGYSPGEILGKNLRLLQGPKTADKARKRLHDALACGRAVCQDIINYRKDGTAFWNRMILVPVREGAHRFYLGIQHDVTERKGRGLGSPYGVGDCAIDHERICDRIRNPLTVLVAVRGIDEKSMSAARRRELHERRMQALDQISQFVEELG